MDAPVIQSALGAKAVATLTVALADPQSSASYFLKAFSDAGGTNPDGGEVQVQAGAHTGTDTDPFVFTWPYAAQSPPIQRWFVVEVDPDGSGSGTTRVASSIHGPLLLGGCSAGSWAWQLLRMGWHSRVCGEGRTHNLASAAGWRVGGCAAAVPSRLLDPLLLVSRRARRAAAHGPGRRFPGHPDQHNSRRGDILHVRHGARALAAPCWLAM